MSSLPNSSASPLLLLPLEEVTDQNPDSNQRVVNLPFFSLADNQVVRLSNTRLPEEINHACCVGSSHGWLAFVNGQKCGFYLVNISTVSPEIIELPSIATLPPLKRMERDSSSKIFSKYHLFNHRTNVFYTETPDCLSRLLIHKFAMSSAPNDGNNNCTIMVSHSEVHDLAFCRIGGPCWIPLKNPFNSRFIEILYSKKNQLFYALTHDGHIEAWDTSPKSIGMAFHLPIYEEQSRSIRSTQKYLVESSEGDILYIVSYYAFVAEDGTDVNPEENSKLPYRTQKFNIYKLDFENRTAEPLTFIGDSVLFLGYNHSFSLLARDYPNLKPNSIYVADIRENFLFYKDYSHGHYGSGVYNLEDHSVTPLNPFGLKEILPAPIWVFRGQ